MAEELGSRTKVLVVEDHAALGEALSFAFSFEADIEVVGLATTVAAAIEMAAATRPDVVLMDVNLPDGNGIDATRQVLDVHPSASVVVLTAHADPVFALRAAEAGASGFVPKDVRMAKIVGAVRAVQAGEVAVDPTVLRSLLAQAAADSDGAGHDPVLPTGPRAVLDLFAQGAGCQEIAGKLGLESSEVNAVVAGLGARSALEALVLAARRGLFRPGPR